MLSEILPLGKTRFFFKMFLINFNQWKYACVGINNLVILLRARYKCNRD